MARAWPRLNANPGGPSTSASNGKPVSIWEHGGVEVDFENESDWDTGEFYGPLLSSYKNRSAY